MPAGRLGRERDAAVVAGGQREPERGQREHDHQPAGGAEPQQRAAHDRGREAVPEAGHVLRGAPLEHAPRDHPQAVDAAAHHRQQRRQERRRRGDRHQRHEQAADAHRAHERQRHEHQQREPHRDDSAREQRRAARGRHRGAQRLVRVGGVGELLAVAEHDEHRVVDGDREADQRDDVGHVDRHLHHVGEDPHEPERHGDRHGGERDGHGDSAQRPEHEHHHQQGDRHRDRLAAREVLVEDVLGVVVDRGVAGQIGLHALDVADRGAHLRRGPGRVLVLQRRRDLEVDDAVPGFLRRARLAVLGLRGGACGRRLHRRALGLALDALGHQREGAVGAYAHPVLEQLEPALGLRPGDAEAVREQPAEVGRAQAAEHEQDQPHGEDTPAVRHDEVGPSRHRSKDLADPSPFPAAHL